MASDGWMVEFRGNNDKNWKEQKNKITFINPILRPLSKVKMFFKELILKILFILFCHIEIMNKLSVDDRWI